ncbi:hypothetical protein ADUPG1_010213, partial [Aduncisulcus paluster]
MHYYRSLETSLSVPFYWWEHLPIGEEKKFHLDFLPFSTSSYSFAFDELFIYSDTRNIYFMSISDGTILSEYPFTDSNVTKIQCDPRGSCVLIEAEEEFYIFSRTQAEDPLYLSHSISPLNKFQTKLCSFARYDNILAQAALDSVPSSVLTNLDQTLYPSLFWGSGVTIGRGIQEEDGEYSGIGACGGKECWGMVTCERAIKKKFGVDSNNHIHHPAPVLTIIRRLRNIMHPLIVENDEIIWLKPEIHGGIEGDFGSSSNSPSNGINAISERLLGSPGRDNRMSRERAIERGLNEMGSPAMSRLDSRDIFHSSPLSSRSPSPRTRLVYDQDEGFGSPLCSGRIMNTHGITNDRLISQQQSLSRSPSPSASSYLMDEDIEQNASVLKIDPFFHSFAPPSLSHLRSFSRNPNRLLPYLSSPHLLLASLLQLCRPFDEEEEEAQYLKKKHPKISLNAEFEDEEEDERHTQVDDSSELEESILIDSDGYNYIRTKERKKGQLIVDVIYQYLLCMAFSTFSLPISSSFFTQYDFTSNLFDVFCPSSFNTSLRMSFLSSFLSIPSLLLISHSSPSPPLPSSQALLRPPFFQDRVFTYSRLQRERLLNISSEAFAYARTIHMCVGEVRDGRTGIEPELDTVQTAPTNIPATENSIYEVGNNANVQRTLVGGEDWFGGEADDDAWYGEDYVPDDTNHEFVEEEEENESEFYEDDEGSVFEENVGRRRGADHGRSRRGRYGSHRAADNVSISPFDDWDEDNEVSEWSEGKGVDDDELTPSVEEEMDYAEPLGQIGSQGRSKNSNIPISHLDPNSTFVLDRSSGKWAKDDNRNTQQLLSSPFVPCVPCVPQVGRAIMYFAPILQEYIKVFNGVLFEWDKVKADGRKHLDALVHEYSQLQANVFSIGKGLSPFLPSSIPDSYSCPVPCHSGFFEVLNVSSFSHYPSNQVYKVPVSLTFVLVLLRPLETQDVLKNSQHLSNSFVIGMCEEEKRRKEMDYRRNEVGKGEREEGPRGGKDSSQTKDDWDSIYTIIYHYPTPSLERECVGNWMCLGAGHERIIDILKKTGTLGKNDSIIEHGKDSTNPQPIPNQAQIESTLIRYYQQFSTPISSSCLCPLVDVERFLDGMDVCMDISSLNELDDTNPEHFGWYGMFDIAQVKSGMNRIIQGPFTNPNMKISHADEEHKEEKEEEEIQEVAVEGSGNVFSSCMHETEKLFSILTGCQLSQYVSTCKTKIPYSFLKHEKELDLGDSPTLDSQYDSTRSKAYFSLRASPFSLISLCAGGCSC